MRKETPLGCLEFIVHAVHVIHAVHTIHVAHTTHAAHIIHIGFVCLFLILNFVIHCLFSILLCFKSFLSKCLCFFQTVGDNNVIKKCSSLDLPQFKSYMSAAVLTYSVHSFVVLVFGVGDHRVNPFTLVIRVVNHRGFPFTLEFRIIKHGCFPLAIIFIIPISRLGSIGISNFRSNIIVTCWLFVFRVGHLGIVNPVGGLTSIWILDFFGQHKVKFIFQFACADGFVVHKYLKSVVRFDNQCVQMSHIVGFGRHFLFNQKVLVLLVAVENDVRLFVGASTNIWSKHDRISSVSTKGC
mmetsp:Transcript_7951/g.10434  ORF Transcript_7951/g.10434 Transcript_7951/m.10434 type:complete len:297 (+) Transcript_7951:239-1129(+)